MTELTANIRRSFVSQGIGMLLRLAVSVLIARALGPHARGELALALWVPAMFNAVFYFSLGEAALALMNRAGYAKALVVANLNSFALVVIGLGLVLYSGLSSGILRALKGQLPGELYALAFWLFPMTLLWACWAAAHLGFGHVMRVNWGRALNQAALLLMLLACWPLLRQSGYLALIAYLVGAGVELAWLGYWLSRHVPLRLRWTSSVQRQHFRLGAQNTLVVWVGALAQRFDLLLVNAVGGATGVGIYAVAAGLRDFALAIPEVFIRPVMSEASVTPHPSRIPPLGRTLRQAAVLLVSAALVLSLLSPWLVRQLYSETFAASVGVARWLFVGFVAFGLSNIVSAILVGLGRPVFLILSQLGSLTALLGAAWWLGPRWHVTGVAIAVSLSQWVGFLLLLALIWCNDPGLLRSLWQSARRRE
ncbi:MAG: polysaccharide biosynthesis C-terminal domain-containing protein [Candidatus Omnitrophica bacterium]|nr:polysaccharide biosynthesis C-terminal domain-containing protein [Candidatus Omnitrophota bacterium]